MKEKRERERDRKRGKRKRKGRKRQKEKRKERERTKKLFETRTKNYSFLLTDNHVVAANTSTRNGPGNIRSFQPAEDFSLQGTPHCKKKRDEKGKKSQKGKRKRKKKEI